MKEEIRLLRWIGIYLKSYIIFKHLKNRLIFCFANKIVFRDVKIIGHMLGRTENDISVYSRTVTSRYEFHIQYNLIIYEKPFF